MNLFYQPHIKEGVLYLDPEESRHCAKVLRKKTGDTITITDGKGIFYKASLTDIQKDRCTFSILNETPEPERTFNIHIAISPTKHTDRIEWFVEKVVELGVDEISFVICRTSERTHFKTDRVSRIAISAMKQSLRATLPVIHEPIPLAEFMKAAQAEEKYIAHVDTTNPSHLAHLAASGKSYCILIGPEGDFTAEEITQAMTLGYQKVSLGKNRLRTETAGMAACHTLNLVNV